MSGRRDPDDRNKEYLDWDEEYYKSIAGTKPGAKYGPVSESLRHAIPQETACALFCGGRKCKYENPDHWKEDQMAIKGLFSNWVTDNIVAISRPTKVAIEKHGLLDEFHKHGIKSIINLQTPGEHSSCGEPLHASGFSYDPQMFMDNDVFFYNFGWPDYGVGSLANILDMVKVFQFAVSEGKVAVHCHAGLGRTGVMIACYLLYANRMDPGEVVHYIRGKRKGAVQTRNQVLCIHEFAQYLKPIRVVFSDVAPDTYDFNLSQFLTRQKQTLHGFEARTLKFIPKIVYVICERLHQLAGKGQGRHERRNSKTVIMEMASSAFNNRPGTLRQDSTHLSVQSIPSNNTNVSYGGMGTRSRSMEQLNPNHATNRDKYGGLSPNLSMTNRRSRSSGRYGDNSESEGSSDEFERNSKSKNKNKSKNRSMNGSYDVSRPLISVSDHDRMYNEEDFDPKCLAVVEAMILTEYSEEVTEQANKYKVDLNEDTSVWNEISGECDARVLSKLMWDWLDHLKEPILSTQDMPHMLNHVEEPLIGLGRLSKGAKFTTEFLFKTVAQLRPLPENLEVDIVQRILSTLTHQHMAVESTDVTMSTRSIVSRRTLNSGEMTSGLTLRMMQFFYRLLDTISAHLSQVEENERAEQEREQEYTESGNRGGMERKEKKERRRDGERKREGKMKPR